MNPEIITLTLYFHLNDVKLSSCKLIGWVLHKAFMFLYKSVISMRMNWEHVKEGSLTFLVRILSILYILYFAKMLNTRILD